MADTTRKGYHHGNLREALVAAAIPVLREKGVAGLSLREVAKAAGVSHGAPYRHFRDKQALLQAVAARGYEQLAAGCATAEAAHPDDPRRQLVEAGMAYLLYVVRNPEVAGLMFPPRTWEAHLRECADRAVAGLTRIIENGRRAGLYGDYAAGDLTLASLSAVHGLSMLINGALRPDDGEPDEAQVRAMGETVARILLDGMRG